MVYWILEKQKSKIQDRDSKWVPTAGPPGTKEKQACFKDLKGTRAQELDKIIPTHSAEQVVNFQELQVPYRLGWQSSPEAPHHHKQPDVSSSPLAPACKPTVPANAADQPEGSPTYSNYTA